MKCLVKVVGIINPKEDQAISHVTDYLKCLVKMKKEKIISICEHCEVELNDNNSDGENDDMCIDCLNGEFH